MKRAIIIVLILLSLVSLTACKPPPDTKLIAQGHVQNIGWQPYVEAKQGQTLMIGTVGQSLRLEAVKFTIENFSDASIQYTVYNSANFSQGLTGQDGGMAGTTGLSTPIYKFCMLASYDGGNFNSSDYLTYRVHSQDVGWSNWSTKNNEVLGTEGKRLEAIEVRFK